MDVKLNRKDVIIDNLAYENLAQKERIKELENGSKAMLQELIECSYELQCLCGHPACKPCQRYGQLVEFIEEMKKAV